MLVYTGTLESYSFFSYTLAREFGELRVGPGVVPNFVPFRENPSLNFGMCSDIGTYHEERHFDVALLQNVDPQTY